MERITDFHKAYDFVKEGKGRHGVDLRFILKGEHGTITLVIFTNWFGKDMMYAMPASAQDMLSKPLPADIGYHSKVPMHKGQSIGEESCPYCNGKTCYYDGSSLNAERYYDILVTKGSEGLWKEMEEYYIRTFGELT